MAIRYRKKETQLLHRRAFFCCSIARNSSPYKRIYDGQKISGYSHQNQRNEK